MDDDYDYGREAREDAEDGWEYDGCDYGDDTETMLWDMLEDDDGVPRDSDAWLWFEDWVIEHYPVLDVLKTMRKDGLTAEQMLHSLKEDFVLEYGNDSDMLEYMGATRR